MSSIYYICIVLSAVALVTGAATDVGNLRNLRGGTGGSIRRQQRVFDPFDPLTDSFSRALHHQHPDPSPLLTPHRKIQETTPTTNNDDYDDEARATFVEQCTSFLLSSDIVNDGIISQMDFVGMLLHQCQLDNLCNDGLRLNFGQLDINLRVKFIRGICVRSNDDYPERFECIYKLYEMMRDESMFGFNTTVDGVDELVTDMCYETYLDAVHFGFVKTRAPTSSPITGLTNSPSFEVTSVPSISPSTMDTTTPSSSPSIRDTLRPTTTPSIEIASSFPSESPSSFAVIDNDDVDPSASDGDDSMSTGGIAGITSATLFVTAAFVAFMYRYRPISSPDMKSLKDDRHFGASSAHEPWGKSDSSLPIPYMGLNCSVCSSSSSYRDYRFVNVFGPQGTPIPQFNPNTAGAVVIGSVTIRASSSYSSGQFGNSGSSQVRSAKSPSLFMRRKRSHHRHDTPKSDSGFSSRDDLSSISSRRSSFHRSSKYRNRRKMKSIRLDSRDVDPNAQVPLGSLQSSRTNVTVPLSHCQRQQMERQMKSDSQVLFGDWKATLDLSECRSPTDTADAAAILAHRKIVFNTLCPELTQLSNEHITPPSSGCHSLPNMHFVPRAGGSSDAGSSSILSESYFQDGSFLRQQKSVASSTKSASTNPFVPWRSEGFISSRVSDSRQSNESDAPSSSKSNVPEMKQRFNLIRRPAKAVISKYKGSVKDWFSFRNSRQYHYLHKQDGVSALQEDPEVLSMISYSSNTHLLPPREEERDELPNLVLGTFAAASIPIGQKVVLPTLFIGASSAAAGVNAGVSESAEVALDSSATSIPAVEQPDNHPTIRTRVIRSHISSLDANVLHESTDSSSISAYSRSDFESSTPSKDSSYSSPATTNTGQSTSFAAVKEDADDSIRIVTSSNLICLDDVGDADTTFTESRQASLLSGTSRAVVVGKKPSLICDSDESAANEFNIVTRSGSDSGSNFLFLSDEEDNNAVADRKRIVVDNGISTAGQELGPNLITPIEPSTFFPEEL